MLLRPTPLQHATTLLKLWPHALRVAGSWLLGLLDLDTLGLGLLRQRARLPSKIFNRLCRGLKMDRMSEAAPVQKVCRALFRPTSLL